MPSIFLPVQRSYHLVHHYHPLHPAYHRSLFLSPLCNYLGELFSLMVCSIPILILLAFFVNIGRLTFFALISHKIAILIAPLMS
jgi:hypothetical protein